MTRWVSCISILVMVIFAPGCGRKKTSVALPIAAVASAPQYEYETLFTEGLADFHLGTPAGYSRAADAFRRASALKPDRCEYPLSLAQSLLFLATEQQLNWEEYQPRLAAAKAIVDSVGDRCISTHEPLVLRVRALIAGMPQGIDLINRAVDLDPADAMNWVVLGYLDPPSPRLVTPEGSGRWVAMTHAIELRPDSALIQYEFGRNYPSFRGKENEAKQAFQRATQLSPGHFRAYLALAFAADENTDPEPLYLKVVDVAPGFLEGRMALGNYYGSLDEFEKAAEQYSAALSLNPKFDAAHFMWGLVMKQAGRPDDAEKHFIAVTELSSGSAEAYYELGNISYNRNNFDKAKAQYDQAVRFRGNYPEAEYGIGHVYRQKNQIVLAESQFDKVIKMMPRFGDAYMSRADVRTERHDLPGALVDYEKAIEFYEEQVRSLNASIAYAESRSQSRALQSEKKRNERDKARIEALLEHARQYKAETEEVLKRVP